jgi:hypothetical protein
MEITAVEHNWQGPTGRSMRLGPSAAWVCTFLEPAWIGEVDVLAIRRFLESEVMHKWIDDSLRYYSMLDFVDFDVVAEMQKLEQLRAQTPRIAPPVEGASVQMGTAYLEMFDEDTQKVMDDLVGSFIVVNAMNRRNLYVNMTQAGFQSVVSTILHALKNTSPVHVRVMDFINFHMQDPVEFIRDMAAKLCSSVIPFASLASDASNSNGMVVVDPEVRVGPETMRVRMFRDPVFSDIYYALAAEQGRDAWDVDVAIFRRDMSWLDYACHRYTGSNRFDWLLHVAMQSTFPIAHMGVRAVASAILEYAISPGNIQVGHVGMRSPALAEVRLFSNDVPVDLDALLHKMMQNVYSQRLRDLCQSALTGKMDMATIRPLEKIPQRLAVAGNADKPLVDGLVDWRV